MTIQELLDKNATILELVKEYNSNSKTNQILYDNPDVAEILQRLHSVERFDFVVRCNQITKELIPFVTPYHNKSVIVTKDNKQINGIILHPETRTYEERTLDNNVAFRTFENGKDGIALWVYTGDSYSSHLYNSEDITIIE